MTPVSCCSSQHGVPGAADGTLKQSSLSGFTSGPDSKSAAEDNDDEDEEEEDDDDDDDRLSFRIEVKRVDVLLLDGGWCRCFEVGVVTPFEGVELACGDCP